MGMKSIVSIVVFRYFIIGCDFLKFVIFMDRKEILNNQIKYI